MAQGTTQDRLAREDEHRARLATLSCPRAFWIALGILLVAFSKVIFDLASYALRADIHSHALLIPAISAYLLWQDRSRLPVPFAEKSPFAMVFFLAGIVPLAFLLWLRFQKCSLAVPDYLSLAVSSLYFFFLAIVTRFLGHSSAVSMAFPLAFLAFVIPFPTLVQDAIEVAAQVASADAFAWFLDLGLSSYVRDEQIFHMPGLSIQVAQECSGVRSSLVLFITSLLAGHMFLRSAWRRLFLSLSVFPLAIVRNAFRIWTISMLSIHWDPNVIHSSLHHRGGPLFFLLSLVPFFGLLFWLRRSESSRAPNGRASKL